MSDDESHETLPTLTTSDASEYMNGVVKAIF